MSERSDPSAHPSFEELVPPVIGFFFQSCKVVHGIHLSRNVSTCVDDLILVQAVNPRIAVECEEDGADDQRSIKKAADNGFRKQYGRIGKRNQAMNKKAKAASAMNTAVRNARCRRTRLGTAERKLSIHPALSIVRCLAEQILQTCVAGFFHANHVLLHLTPWGS